jgi:hypothetical protein
MPLSGLHVAFQALPERVLFIDGAEQRPLPSAAPGEASHAVCTARVVQAGAFVNCTVTDTERRSGAILRIPLEDPATLAAARQAADQALGGEGHPVGPNARIITDDQGRRLIVMPAAKPPPAKP